MGVWKSRTDKEPPAQFFAEVVAYLDKSYPRASLSVEVMESLRPFLAQEWRGGQSAHDAAKATCACDGVAILPSPATAIELARRAVRPPKGAVRGEVFGVAQLREPAPLAKARVDVEVARRHVEHYEELITSLQDASPKGQRSIATRDVKLAQAREGLAKWATEEAARGDIVRQLLAVASWSRRDGEAPKSRAKPAASKPAPAKGELAQKKAKGEGGTPSKKPATGEGSIKEAKAGRRKGQMVPAEPAPQPNASSCKECRASAEPELDDLDALIGEFSAAELEDLSRGERS